MNRVARGCAADLDRLVEVVAHGASRVDTAAICSDAEVMSSPTSIGTMRGADSRPAERALWPDSEKRRHEDVAALFAAGIDPFARMLSATRDRGREAWISFRMNDDHGDDFLRTPFRAEPPEWAIGGGRNAGRDALDFGRGEVTEHVFRQIEEAAMVETVQNDGDTGDKGASARKPTFFMLLAVRHQGEVTVQKLFSLSRRSKVTC